MVTDLVIKCTRVIVSSINADQLACAERYATLVEQRIGSEYAGLFSKIIDAQRIRFIDPNNIKR